MKKKLYSLQRRVLRFFKKQFRSPRKRLIIEGISAAAIIGIILFIVFSGKDSGTDDLKKGLSYLQAMEEKDTAPIEKEIKAIKKAERKAALESGKMDVWQQFSDSAILGDSRAVGFSYHEFVDATRVMAEGGATIRDIPKYIDKLKALNPSTIFLCFGLNDISIGNWDTAEEYIAELDDMVALLQSEIKGATVFVNSTIPAIEPAFERSAKWKAIPQWNEAIKAHCEEKLIPYIDINETVNEHMELYDPDGIHMKKEFYEYWAIDMVTEVNEYE